MTYRNDKSGVGPRQKHNTSPQFLNGTKKEKEHMTKIKI